MPNNYFRFKQFTVYQDKCAMKVCTDACLFGSFAASLPLAGSKVLDIGTGTGLLALMYAQKHPDAIIDAVEIDEAAARQAAENFAASPWGDRLKAINTPVQEFSSPTGYDLITSNPPFFENDLKSNDTKRNIALHSEALVLDELLTSIERLLKKDGMFAVLLPYQRLEYFEELATEKHFHLTQKILVKQTPVHNFFRGILYFTRQATETIQQEIIIQDAQQQYTPAFSNLLQDYYLHL